MKDWLKHNWFKVSLIILTIVAGTLVLVGYNKSLETKVTKSDGLTAQQLQQMGAIKVNQPLNACLSDAENSRMVILNEYRNLSTGQVYLPAQTEADNQYNQDRDICFKEYPNN